MVRRVVQALLAVPLLGLALLAGASGASASGICTGSVSVTPDINPGADYLALLWQASGVTGCTQPLYQYYFWNGSAAEPFTTYSASPSAYWDTHNLVGESYVMVLVKDATSPYSYDTYSPWYPIELNSHGYGDSWDDRVQGVYLQNIDPQGVPHDSGGYLPTGLLTYIEFLPSSNAIASDGTGQCASGGAVYGWQGAYDSGAPGNGPNGWAFVQPGTAYACSGGAGAVFAVSETSEQINCPLYGASNFGASDDQLLYDQYGDAIGVSASSVPEYKGCFVSASSVGISPGSTAPFEISSSGTQFQMWANVHVIFWAAQSGNTAGFYAPWLDTELAQMSNTQCGGCVEAPGIGDNLNNGLMVNSLMSSSWYWDETAGAWVQLSNNTGGVWPVWEDEVFSSSNFILGSGAYCDRAFGYYGGWGSYSSSYIFAKDLHGAC